MSLSQIGGGDVLEGLGKYRLKHLIGEGGMGRVFLADVIRQPSDFPLPDLVAIKILAGPEDFSELAWRREISIMRSMNHPNIVPIYDWGFSESLTFAVLGYCEEGSLHDLVTRGEGLDPERAFTCAEDMLAALVETHAQGVLHLDIKMRNILVGDEGHFLLTDFGISRMLFQGGLKKRWGSPAYMSPDHARGQLDKLVARSDLFSFGTTLYYALVGNPYFDKNPEEVVVIRGWQTLPSLEDKVSAAYKPLAGIVDRMLSFYPKDRFGSAAEALAALRQVRQGLEVDYTPVGKPLSVEWRVRLHKELSDPILRELLSTKDTAFRVRIFEDGELLCKEEEFTFDVFILLHGRIEILRSNKVLASEQREGAILGEVSALVGKARTATLRARSTTVAAMLNGSELEQAVRRMPGLGMRIMKSLAERLVERDERRNRN